MKRNGALGNYHKTDILVKESSSFKSDGSVDPSIVDSLKFDKNSIAKVIAQNGATIRDLETWFEVNEYEEKTFLDIGVLRLPRLRPSIPQALLRRIHRD